MTEADENWRQEALDDFRQWLRETAQAVATPAPPPAVDGWQNGIDCDLHTLFSGFAALRQEVHLQNREQSRATRQLGEAAQVYETSADDRRRIQKDIAALDRQTSRQAENRCLESFLDMRDALVRGLNATGRKTGPISVFGFRQRQLDGIAEGYEMALKRFDRVLGGFGVTRVDALGCKFDPETMRAMETVSDTKTDDGEVVKEFLCGFRRGADILRLADVAVNRHPLEK